MGPHRHLGQCRRSTADHNGSHRPGKAGESRSLTFSPSKGQRGISTLPLVFRHDCIGQGIERTRNRSEEHTSELQSLMRISYAVFCLKKKTILNDNSDKYYTKKLYPMRC